MMTWTKIMCSATTLFWIKQWPFGRGDSCSAEGPLVFQTIRPHGETSVICSENTGQAEDIPHSSCTKWGAGSFLSKQHGLTATVRLFCKAECVWVALDTNRKEGRQTVRDILPHG
jgi:hypothetical protein